MKEQFQLTDRWQRWGISIPLQGAGLPEHRELIVHGSPAACRERVESYVANGLDTPIIALLPTGDHPAELLSGLAPR